MTLLLFNDPKIVEFELSVSLRRKNRPNETPSVEEHLVSKGNVWNLGSLLVVGQQ